MLSRTTLNRLSLDHSDGKHRDADGREAPHPECTSCKVFYLKTHVIVPCKKGERGYPYGRLVEVAEVVDA